VAFTEIRTDKMRAMARQLMPEEMHALAEVYGKQGTKLAAAD
jgi:hypothetical protein